MYSDPAWAVADLDSGLELSWRSLNLEMRLKACCPQARSGKSWLIKLSGDFIVIMGSFGLKLSTMKCYFPATGLGKEFFWLDFTSTDANGAIPRIYAYLEWN